MFGSSLNVIEQVQLSNFLPILSPNLLNWVEYMVLSLHVFLEIYSERFH